MKVDCSKKQIDLNKIHYGIEKFKAKHDGNNPSYIVMNYETRSDIVNINSWYYYYTYKGTKNEIQEEERLFDIPIAYNKGLKFGEVDIV